MGKAEILELLSDGKPMMSQEIISYFAKINNSQCESCRRALKTMRENNEVSFIPLTPQNMKILVERSPIVQLFMSSHKSIRLTRGVRFLYFIKEVK